MSTKNIDMTEGNAVRHILVFAVPMLIGNIFQQLYNLADSVIVGKLIGANALAATGATGPITFFFFAICNGIGSGGGIITSQYFGSKDYKKVKSCIANTGYIMITFPVIVGTIAFFLAGPLLTLLKTPSDIIADAISYTKIMVRGTLNGVGDALFALINGIVEVIGRFVVPVAMTAYMGLGVMGIWWSVGIVWFISGVTAWMRYLKYLKFTRTETA